MALFCFYFNGLSNSSIRIRNVESLETPPGTQIWNNVVWTSMQRHDVASTLMRHCINVMCSLGPCDNLNLPIHKLFCRTKTKLLLSLVKNVYRYTRFFFLFFFFKSLMSFFTLTIYNLGRKMIKYYENTPIQIYWKFYHQKMTVFW